MAGLNKVMIIGNLGRDPEMRYLPSGAPVTNFSVAVTRRFKGSDGEQREETEWFNVECFNKLAEIANEYLTKGRPVYIEGRLRTRSWDDKQTGEKKYRTELIAQEMQMLGARGDAPQRGADREGPEASPASRDDYDFDNMPF
jgi:single-strand DNA-binding protein